MNAPEIIEQARLDRGLSLRAAATAAAISDSRWRQVAKGEPAPDDTLAKMALAVGLTPTDLTGDPDHPHLPDLIADITPAYEASVNMRHRIGALAQSVMPEHRYLTPRDLSRAAGVAKGVAEGFLDGHPWPTTPELEKLCVALDWDPKRVDGLVWSGRDPNAVTAPSLSTKTTTTWADTPATEPAAPESGPTLQDHEERIARLEQALADYLASPTTEEAAQVLRRLQDPPVDPPREAFDLAADWPERERESQDNDRQGGRD
ncbi:MAG: hypothetical protein QJR09_07990 [Micrococcus sp.]|nr:hypothetical protein [Micrococcus sp.]